MRDTNLEKLKRSKIGSLISKLMMAKKKVKFFKMEGYLGLMKPKELSKILTKNG